MRKSLILIPVFAAIAAYGSNAVLEGLGGEKGPALARIDGDTFTEGDLELRLNAYEDARRDEILKDPEQRRREFAGILRSRLYSLAGRESAFGKSESLRRRAALIFHGVVQ